MQRHDFFYQKTTLKRSGAATAIVPSDTGQASQECIPLKGFRINEQRAPLSFFTKLALARLGGYMRSRLAASGLPEQFDCGQLVRGLEWPQEGRINFIPGEEKGCSF